MEARGNQIFHCRPKHENQEDDSAQTYSFGRLKHSRDEHREEVARTGDRLQRTIERQSCRRRRGVLQKNGGRYFASKDEPIRRRGPAYTRQARKQYNCMSQPAREPHVCCMSNSGTAWYPVHSERIHPGCIHSLAIYPRKGGPMGAVICLACTSSRWTLAARSVASRVLCRIRDIARRSPQLRQYHVSSADHPKLDRMRIVLREDRKKDKNTRTGP